jgi:hypothetical protein
MAGERFLGILLLLALEDLPVFLIEVLIFLDCDI